MKHYGIGKRLLSWLCVVVMLAMMVPMSGFTTSEAVAGEQEPAIDVQAVLDGEEAGDGGDGEDDTKYTVTFSIENDSCGTVFLNGTSCSNGGKLALTAGTEVELTITPITGYKVTTTPSQFVSGSAQSGDAYTGYTVTFTMPSYDMTVSVVFERRDYVDIRFDLTNLEETSVTPLTVYTDSNESYTWKLEPAEGYRLPESIEFKVGDTDLENGTDYTWDSSTGEITIVGSTLATAGDDLVCVTAEGVQRGYVDVEFADSLERHYSCDGGSKAYTDEDYTATITPKYGYKLDSLTVKVGDSDTPLEKGTDYTVEEKADDITPSVTVYTITVPKAKLTGTLKFSAEVSERTDGIILTSELENLSWTNLTWAVDQTIYAEDEENGLTQEMQASAHYQLPESVTVKVEGEDTVLVAGTDYEWNQENGEISIKQAALAANKGKTLVIEAAGVPIEYTVTVTMQSVPVSGITRTRNEDTLTLSQDTEATTSTYKVEETTEGSGKDKTTTYTTTFKATYEDEVVILFEAPDFCAVPDSLTVTGIEKNRYSYEITEKIFNVIAKKSRLTINAKSINSDGIKISNETAASVRYAELEYELHGFKDTDNKYLVANLGDDFSVRLTALDGCYIPPDTIEVKYGNTVLADVTDAEEAEEAEEAQTEGYIWDNPYEDADGNDFGKLTILSDSLSAAVAAGEKITITATAKLNPDKLNFNDFDRDTVSVDEDGNKTFKTNWNNEAVLIEPQCHAEKIVVNGKEYDGVIFGTNNDNINREEEKTYYEIKDCKNFELKYKLTDGTVASDEKSIYLTVDTTNPAVSVTGYSVNPYSEDNITYYTNDTISVTFTATDTNFKADTLGEYQVMVNGAEITEGIAWDGDNCTVTLSAKKDEDGEQSGYEDGEYSIKLTVTDDAGHSKSATSETLVLDTTPPEVKITGYSVNAYSDTNTHYVNGSIAITFQVTETNFDEDRVSMSGLPTYTRIEWTHSGDVHTKTVTIATDKNDDGVYGKIKLSVKDKAGNSGDKTADPIVLDTTNPVVEVKGYSVDEYKDGKYYTNGSVEVTFTATDTNFKANALGEYQVTVNGAEITEGIAWDGDNCIVTLDKQDYADGEYKVALTVTDAAGNSNSASSGTLVIDTTPPEIVSVSYAENDDGNDKGGFAKLWNEIWWWITGRSDADNSDYNGEKRTVTATVTICDTLSPIDSYSIGDSVTFVSFVPDDNAREGYHYQSTLTFTAEAQFMEKLTIKATDAAGNESDVYKTETETGEDGNEIVKGSPNLLIDTYEPVINFGSVDYDTVHSSDYAITVTVTDPAEDNVYSGLAKVTVSVHYQKDGTNVSVGEITGYTYADDVYTKTIDTTAYEQEETQTETFTVRLPASLNSNLVYVEVTAVDNAGNTVTSTTKDDGQYIKMDDTAPVVSVVYDNNSAQNSKYFMQSRTATITVTDNNFDAGGMNITTQGTAGSWSATGAVNADGQNNVYTCTVSYATDADYTLSISATDLGGNTTADTLVDYSGQTAPQDFTVDLTDPTFSIGLENESGEISGGGYSNQTVTVTLTVNEHNFDASAATAGLTVIYEGRDISASIRSGLSWSSSGDVRTAVFTLADDGEYKINLSFQDMAGNSTAAASDVVVYVDQTEALVYVTGVADRSANAAKKVAPVVTIWDKYYNEDGVVIRLRNGAGEDVTEQYLDLENDRSEVLYDEERDLYYQTFTFRNISDDHVYWLEVLHTDLAGNTNTTMIVLNSDDEEVVLDIGKDTMRFSVNRNGSTYSASEETLAILGQYLQSVKNVSILEVNVDELDPASIYITLTHDNITRDLVYGVDYTYQTPPDQNDVSWNVYEYVFEDSLFAEDGVYTITIYSVDAAGNVAQNNTEEKNFEITFVVDKTPPIFVAVDLEAGEIYNEDQHTATINCSDNIALDTVHVYRLDSTAEKDENGNYIWFREKANGEIEMLCEEVEVTAVEGSNGDYTFVLYEGDSAATSKQSVLVVCTDKAGNQNLEQEILDFTVSSSFWIRFYANKPLFYGSIGGISALLILAAILFLNKKKEED